MLGLEALHLQGIWPTLPQSRLDNALLHDLAGNAFCTLCVQAAYLTLLTVIAAVKNVSMHPIDRIPAVQEDSDSELDWTAA